MEGGLKREKKTREALEKADIIEIEQIVFDSDIELAGTMDLFIRAKKNGQLWILDYKTNERIDAFNRRKQYALKADRARSEHELLPVLPPAEPIRKHPKRAGYVDRGEKIEKALLRITERGNRTYPLGDMQKEIGDMIGQFRTETL